MISLNYQMQKTGRKQAWYYTFNILSDKPVQHNQYHIVF